MRAAYLAPAAIGASSLHARNYVSVARIRGTSSLPTLGEVVRVPEASSFIFRQVDCAQEHGEEFLSQTDIFAAEPVGRFVRRDLMPAPEGRRIRRLDILIAGAGQMEENNLFGRSILGDARLEGKLACGDAVILRPAADEDTHLYVAAFLASKAGLQAVRSTAYGSSIPRPRLDLLAALPIPLPNSATRSRIAELIRASVELRERCHGGIQAARASIQALPEMVAAHEVSAARRARCLAWTGPLPALTAWTFASSGEALGLLQRSWRGSLGDLVPAGGIFRGGRYPRTPCHAPHGVDFHSQRDAFMIRAVPQRIAASADAIRSLRCENGWLLAGGQGTLGEGEVFGRVALVGEETAGACFTEHLLRIRIPKSDVEVAFAFLSTLVGMRLLRSCAVGTKLLSLRPDMLRALPFPDLDTATHDLVTAQVRAAMGARASASAAEREAVRIVEEEVLPQWLA